MSITSPGPSGRDTTSSSRAVSTGDSAAPWRLVAAALYLFGVTIGALGILECADVMANRDAYENVLGGTELGWVRASRTRYIGYLLVCAAIGLLPLAGLLLAKVRRRMFSAWTALGYVILLTATMLPACL